MVLAEMPTGTAHTGNFNNAAPYTGSVVITTRCGHAGTLCIGTPQLSRASFCNEGPTSKATLRHLPAMLRLLLQSTPRPTLAETQRSAADISVQSQPKCMPARLSEPST